MTLVIAQLSDVHLGFSGAYPDANAERLVEALAAVVAERPDALFVTGDLTEDGNPVDYARLRELLAGVPCPVHLTIGNHDLRANFRAAFPETPTADGFVQYAVEVGGLRCLVLDTLEEGRHGGGFCAARAAWLGQRLDETPDRPTLILLHHPPVTTGIAWMDPGPQTPWIDRIERILYGRTQVVALAAGHVHTPCITAWHGRPVTVAPSVAPALALSLAAINAERPDHRAMIVDSAPGFALHRWDGARLTTHFGIVAPPVLARYDVRMQPFVRQMIAERSDN